MLTRRYLGASILARAGRGDISGMHVLIDCARIRARDFPRIDTLTITSMLPGIAGYYPDPRVAKPCDTAQVDIQYVISKWACHGVRYAGVASAEVALCCGGQPQRRLSP